MPIKYFIQKRKIVKNSVAYTKYIPVMQLEAVVGFEQIAEMVEKKSTMSKGDILGVLSEVESAAAIYLENGHPVKLGMFGTFYPVLEVDSVDTPEEVNSSLIKRLRCVFKPSKFLKNILKRAEFHLGDRKVREVVKRKKDEGI